MPHSYMILTTFAYEERDEKKQRLTGPPMAPRMTASAALAALRASSVNGLPGLSAVFVASMHAFRFCKRILKDDGLGKRTYSAEKFFLEMKAGFWLAFLKRSKNLLKMSFEYLSIGIHDTLTASAVTSGPQ